MATPEEDDYYKEMLKNIIKVKNNEDGPLCNEKIWQAVIDLREEIDVEHERNIKKSNAMIYISLLWKKRCINNQWFCIVRVGLLIPQTVKQQL